MLNFIFEWKGNGTKLWILFLMDYFFLKCQIVVLFVIYHLCRFILNVTRGIFCTRRFLENKCILVLEIKKKKKNSLWVWFIAEVSQQDIFQQEFGWTLMVNQVFNSLEEAKITRKWLENILVPGGVLQRWTQGQQSAKCCF